jgi:uncharacterized protein YndB with AHSA1/START domain
MEEYGVISAPGTVRIERVLPGPINLVWACLTQSERRARWLASGEMDVRVGGKVELRFFHADLSDEKIAPERYKEMGAKGHVMHGVITRCEPPRLLAYTWGGEKEPSEVTFELTPRGEETLLVLTHAKLANRAGMVSVGSGWHSHLGVLIDHLAGRKPRPFWTTVMRMNAEYEQRFPAD